MDADYGQGSPVLSFLREVRSIDQLATNLVERHLPKGLTISQFAVLDCLVRTGREHMPFELAQLFQVTKGAMTNTIKKLETQGYALVTGDPNDGRRKRVLATEAGRDACERARVGLRPLFGELSDCMDESDLHDVLPLLAAFRSRLEVDRGGKN